MHTKNNKVKKRETFYLGGYDPRGARHYYNLYKKEAISQAKVNGMQMEISAKVRTEENIQSWQINSITNNENTQTNYHYLEWDDIVRKRWTKDFISLFFDLIFYLKTYIFSGRFMKYAKVSPYQMFFLFSPMVFLLFSIVIAGVVGYTIFYFFNGIFTLLLAIAISIYIMYWLFILGDKLGLFWLLRIFVFSGRYALEDIDGLEKRLEILSSQIARYINNAKSNDVDEILLVSHSVGTILIIPLLEKTLKKLTKPIDTTLSVLVLGECIPLVSGVNIAKDYKEKMSFLAKQHNIFWVDYTTVIDGACFPNLNYFTDAKIIIEKKENFHFLSPRFHTLFSKEKYTKLRKNKYLSHFMYLKSTEYEGAFDFFKMTAGHQYLCDILSFNYCKK